MASREREIPVVIPIGRKEVSFGRSTGKYTGFVTVSCWLLPSPFRSPVERAGEGRERLEVLRRQGKI